MQFSGSLATFFGTGHRQSTIWPRPPPIYHSHIDLGVTVDTSLKFLHHISPVVHKSTGLCQSFLKATVCHKPKFMLFFYMTHVRPIMWCDGYASCVWNTRLCGRFAKAWAHPKKVGKAFERVGGVTILREVETVWPIFCSRLPSQGWPHPVLKDFHEKAASFQTPFSPCLPVLEQDAINGSTLFHKGPKEIFLTPADSHVE